MRPNLVMMRSLLRGPVVLALVVALTGVPASLAQAQAASSSSRPSGSSAATAQNGSGPVSPDTTPYPVDVNRIREAVQRLPAVKFDEQQLRFYVLILAKEPGFVEKFAKDYDFRNGPTRGGAAMNHQEFLNMVTPKELNELFGITSGSTFAMFQAALMNAAGQALVKKAIQEIRNARNEREVQAIRARIDRELAALLGKDQ